MRTAPRAAPAARVQVAAAAEDRLLTVAASAGPAIPATIWPRPELLREAVFGLVVSLSAGTTIATADRRIVNAAATATPPTATLGADATVHRRGGLRAALAMIARDAVDLADGRRPTPIRWCADAACTRPFVDHSRGQRRRWCGMSGGGDRNKAAAYRRRQRRDRSTV